MQSVLAIGRADFQVYLCLTLQLDSPPWCSLRSLVHGMLVNLGLCAMDSARVRGSSEEPICPIFVLLKTCSSGNKTF